MPGVDSNILGVDGHAGELASLGFQVLKALDLDLDGFDKTYQRFSQLLDKADIGLIFYAGHGLQYKGQNFLLPVNARLKNIFSIQREGFPLNAFIQLMKQKARLSMVFLDACRNNPLATRLNRSLTLSRSASPLPQGLSRIERIGSEMLIVYATAPNAIAADGQGRNSPFTKALLRHISTPNIEVEVMLKRVTRMVQESTGQLQKPERLSRLISEFYFNPATAPHSDEKESKQAPALPLPDLVVLKGGSFIMGCQQSSACPTDELPAHRVQLDSFAITRHEITFAQYDACVAQGGCPHRPRDQGWGRGQRPVINVSWHEANSYALWLSQKTGQTWRLPTEAEWEYAARAGTTTPYAFGQKISSKQANFDFHNKQTQPVGRYPANGFGLYDMHGNVWEWVSDFYQKDWYRHSPSDNPQGPTSGTSRVFRGGSWMYRAIELRSSERNAYAPDFRSRNVGFRLVREEKR